MKIDENMRVLIQFLEAHKGEVGGFRFKDHVKGYDYTAEEPHEFKLRKIKNPVQGTIKIK